MSRLIDALTTQACTFKPFEARRGAMLFLVAFWLYVAAIVINVAF